MSKKLKKDWNADDAERTDVKTIIQLRVKTCTRWQRNREEKRLISR